MTIYDAFHKTLDIEEMDKDGDICLTTTNRDASIDIYLSPEQATILRDFLNTQLCK